MKCNRCGRLFQSGYSHYSRCAKCSRFVDWLIREEVGITPSYRKETPLSYLIGVFLLMYGVILLAIMLVVSFRQVHDGRTGVHESKPTGRLYAEHVAPPGDFRQFGVANR